MRHLVAPALLAGLLAGPALAAPPVPPAETLPSVISYCDATGVSGSVDYTPGIQVGATAQSVSWVMNLHFSCTGTGVFNGTYDLTVEGSGTESCAGGTGIGVVTGGSKSTGPGTGPIVGGSLKFQRAALHYYISHPANGLEFTVSETVNQVDRLYRANLWLDLPSYLRPVVATSIAAPLPAISPEGLPRLTQPSVGVDAQPGPCVDNADLTGHGFLGERNAVVQQLDEAVAAAIGRVVG